MQVNSISYLPKNYYQNKSYNGTDKTYFGAKIFKTHHNLKIGFTDIDRILTEDEFKKVFNNLKNGKFWRKYFWNESGINVYEQALIPYVGLNDISLEINHLMREGNLLYKNTMPENVLKDFIRVFDYALKKIDKMYGNYEGIVFRHGIFNTLTKNYVSTARNSYGAVQHLVYDPHNHAYALNQYDIPYNIIYTNHGHKIENLQRKLGSHFETESEILLDPNVKYRKITNLTDEMIYLKKNFLDELNSSNCLMKKGHAKIHFYKEI